MISLFDNELGNLLPYDGEVLYHGPVLDLSNSQHYTHRLLNHIQWQNDEAIIFGKHIVTRRKVAWYADGNFPYAYSGLTRNALPWTDDLLELKEQVESIARTSFNSCLLNLYNDGDDGMAWHSDDEKSLEPQGTIASLSLGAERKFAFKHKTSKQTVSLVLANGSLLEMKGLTQQCWLHSLPKTKKVKHLRINLTFRTMV